MDVRMDESHHNHNYKHRPFIIVIIHHHHHHNHHHHLYIITIFVVNIVIIIKTGSSKPERNDGSFSFDTEEGDVSNSTVGSISPCESEASGGNASDNFSGQLKKKQALEGKAHISKKSARSNRRKATVLRFLTKNCGYRKVEAKGILDILILKHSGFDFVYSVLKWRRNNKENYNIPCRNFLKKEFPEAKAEFEKKDEIRDEVRQDIMEFVPDCVLNI
jgi:hypothetical protein